jgi:hypothetical protein
VGVRHALFPRSLAFGAQLHPSSVVGCQFPDAAPVCMDNCKPFRPRNGAGPGVATDGIRVRLLSPGFHAPAGALPPDPVRNASENVASDPLLRKVGIGPFGLDRLPCATGLASYPSSCLPISRGRPRFRRLPLLGSYCASSVIAGHPAPSNRSTQSAMILPLFTSRLRNRNVSTAHLLSQTVRNQTTTLAHSSNYRS